MKLKAVLANAGLFLLGTLVSLGGAELYVRITRPELRDLVETVYVKHMYRYKDHPRNLVTTRQHPDKRKEHLVIYNSLGFRQHREFPREKPENTIRIGFFGDSFTENIRCNSQYSFTEPLEYLLNRTGKASFEIMNFGVDGYGTDQVYLKYLEDGTGRQLDLVVYLYCENDLTDILADGLVKLDEKGKIKYIPPAPTGILVTFFRRFYLTYFLLEKVVMLKARSEKILNKKYKHLPELLRKGQEDPALRKSLSLFTALIKEMKDRAKRNSSEFYVVLFPGYKDSQDEKGVHNQKIMKLLEALKVKALDLLPGFRYTERVYRNRLYFKNDGHWNEEGNKIAAVYLFKFLTENLGIQVSDEFIKKGLFEYYCSFIPQEVEGPWMIGTPIPPPLRRKIGAKYLALDQKLKANRTDIFKLGLEIDRSRLKYIRKLLEKKSTF